METRPLSRRPTGRGGKKLLRPALALAFLVGSVLCSNAWADRGGWHHGYHGYHGYYGHHGHYRGGGHVGVFIGAPLYWGSGWYGDPYYGYPYGYRPYVPEPPVYIERGVTPAGALWYFCGNPEGYYPYVKQCSMPWRTVTPQSVTR